MVKSSRVLGYLGVIWCLLWLLFACAPEPASGEGVPTSADFGGVDSDRATATPTSLAPTPRGSLHPVTTPGVKLLTPISTLVKEEVMPTADVSPGLQGLVDLAVSDLAERLTIDVEQIEVVEVKAVVWPDGSLGCPQPGMQYAQVLTAGHLILLEANGQEYEYHASRNTIAHCENPMPPVSGTPLDQ